MMFMSACLREEAIDVDRGWIGAADMASRILRTNSSVCFCVWKITIAAMPAANTLKDA